MEGRRVDKNPGQEPLVVSSDLYGALLALLDARISATSEAAERRRLARLRHGLVNVGRDVGTELLDGALAHSKARQLSDV